MSFRGSEAQAEWALILELDTVALLCSFPALGPWCGPASSSVEWGGEESLQGPLLTAEGCVGTSVRLCGRTNHILREDVERVTMMLRGSQGHMVSTLAVAATCLYWPLGMGSLRWRQELLKSF